MPVVLKLDTKPSLFEPNEIEIDGTKYAVKEITLGSLEKIQGLQADLVSGSATALRMALESLIEGDIGVLKDLQVSKIRKLVNVLLERAVTPTDEEKNGPGPGAE
jgi:hypothetical protein